MARKCSEPRTQSLTSASIAVSSSSPVAVDLHCLQEAAVESSDDVSLFYDFSSPSVYLVLVSFPLFLNLSAPFALRWFRRASGATCRVRHQRHPFSHQPPSSTLSALLPLRICLGAATAPLCECAAFWRTRKGDIVPIWGVELSRRS